jgi:hypothetical protein
MISKYLERHRMHSRLPQGKCNITMLRVYRLLNRVRMRIAIMDSMSNINTLMLTVTARRYVPSRGLQSRLQLNFGFPNYLRFGLRCMFCHGDLRVAEVVLGPPDENRTNFGEPGLGTTVSLKVTRIETEKTPYWEITSTATMAQAQALGALRDPICVI